MVDNKLYDLLLRSFDEKLQPIEAGILKDGLKQSSDLREENKKILEMRELISGRRYAFKSGFKVRVLARLHEEKKPLLLKPEFDRSMYSVFKRVVITGVAAVVILFLSLYFTGNSILMDPAKGGTLFSEEDLVSYLLYDNIH